MQYAALFMMIFSAAIFIYGVILLLTEDINLIMRHHAASITNERDYAAKVGKILIFVSFAPVLSGLIGLLTDSAIFMVIALIAGFIILTVLGIKYSKI